MNHTAFLVYFMKRTLIPALSIGLVTTTGFGAENRSLAERLGYKATDRILIVNGDDTGMCHAANRATIDCLERGAMRSATIMVPCPWFPEIAAYARQHPDKGFGVHLCHTSEWVTYRWGPVADRSLVPGLLDPDGYLWREVEDVYKHAKPEEALIEGRAQIKKALAAGIDVTHLDSHMGTLQLNPDYIKVYVQLAREFNLPLRMASQETLARFGQPDLRQRVAAQGILFPDYFVYDELKDEKNGVKEFWLRIVKNLKRGVTELYIHAGLPTDELKAATGSWSTRAQEYEVFTNDEDMKRLLKEENIILMGYRPIRDLQRAEQKAGAGK
ncbi:MAG TPA: polysaccharide deacetylase family protein [Verrucomicrobiota bacterium]|nr:polysaccharide deacetylase family protein [Verrucomicrobiota bacterium]HNT13598.1 polysaccharide deacetylase family protein [Verrucomicrobiota bacterium]